MTYATYSRLGAQPGKRDEMIAILTRHWQGLDTVGCLMYEVGVIPGDDNGVHVIELWEHPDSHKQSLQLPSVKAAIAELWAILDGDPLAGGFEVLGTPLRKPETHDTSESPGT